MSFQLNILIVSGHEHENAIIRKVFEQIYPHCDFVQMGSPAEAEGYIFAEKFGKPLNKVHMLIMDTVYPAEEEFALLEKLRAVENFNRLPVIMLAMQHENDQAGTAYDKMANCYIPKPLDEAAYISTIDAIARYWLETARLPDSTFNT
jgi:DNA-binding response OmpR family regulator